MSLVVLVINDDVVKALYSVVEKETAFLKTSNLKFLAKKAAHLAPKYPTPILAIIASIATDNILIPEINT